MSVSLSIILDTRRIKTKSNKFPLKLRVTWERETCYYTLKFEMSEADYSKLSASNISADIKHIRDKIKSIELHALIELEKIEDFSFEVFERNYIKDNSFFKQKKPKTTFVKIDKVAFDYTPYLKKFPILKDEHPAGDYISTIFLKKIKELIQQERISSAASYHCSYKSLFKFKGNVRFKTINVTYLVQYEKWCKSTEMSKTTISIYLRCLRAIFNEAIAEKIIKQDIYPFGKRKYIIPRTRNTKKALKLNDISLIYYADTLNESEQKARDYWLFSYIANGMNPKDIAQLQFKNIEGEYIRFSRAKTENAVQREEKQISVYLNEDLKEIIKRWGNSDTSPGNYIFPVLKKGMTALRQYEIIQLFLSFINANMKRLCERLGMEKTPTTIYARHSCATQLKRAGASVEFIQETLGHTNKNTTENYLDSFENEVKKEFSEKLLAFKQVGL
ncbi:MAG: site-specific integrase [Chitinophagaceae bacterium]|nr:site-specific integrase [Chitinophagaceae bacterium]